MKRRIFYQEVVKYYFPYMYIQCALLLEPSMTKRYKYQYQYLRGFLIATIYNLLYKRYLTTYKTSMHHSIIYTCSYFCCTQFPPYSYNDITCVYPHVLIHLHIYVGRCTSMPKFIKVCKRLSGQALITITCNAWVFPTV